MAPGLKRRHIEIDIQRINDECNGRKKKKEFINSINVTNGNASSAPSTPTKYLPLTPPPPQIQHEQQSIENPKSIGPYRILGPLEENSSLLSAVDTRKENRLVICRRLNQKKYDHLMKLAHQLTKCDRKCANYDEEDENERAYEQIFPRESEMILGDDGCYYFFEPKHFGSLHSYVVERKRLSETEALWYFRQILSLVAYCHQRRIVLRDLKLRKFVFIDSDRRQIRLDGLDELFVCGEDGDDRIYDRHGCPAYVGPEILDLKQKSYSGRAADIWSLGVLLYVILYGRYPFYDTTPARLFAKIRQGSIQMEETSGAVSFDVRTLIRCLLRRDPSERPSAEEVLAHPWLQSKDRVQKRFFSPPIALINTITGQFQLRSTDKNSDNDQCVPCVDDVESATSKNVKSIKKCAIRPTSSNAVPNQ